jgi:hypothetical protein
LDGGEVEENRVVHSINSIQNQTLKEHPVHFKIIDSGTEVIE